MKHLTPKNVLCYDKGDDSLTFIRDSAGIRTINAGLTLLTFNKRNEITALELMGAEENFRIPNYVLEGLKNAKINFHFNKEKKILIINIFLTYKKRQPAPVTITEDLSRFKSIIINDQSMTASICD